MKACVIVAEYNPFHNGHAWHIQEAKKQSHADVMIAIMSGNFVQRGELAIVDKWKRAELALKFGIDIVVELPTLSAVQGADYFGREAIKLANSLATDYVAFGCENPNEKLLMAIAERLECQPLSDKDFTRSYHEQVKEHIAKHVGEEAAHFVELPNNQLAIAYARAIKQLRADIAVIPIQRQKVKHNSQKIAEHSYFASGTAIRRALVECQDVSDVVPVEMCHYFNEYNLDNVIMEHEMWWSTLKIRLLTESVECLKNYAYVDEGIEYRLKKVINSTQNYTDFIEQMLSKRWRRARIQRMCLAIILGITKDAVHTHLTKDIDMIRVLGFTNQGRDYLKKLDNVEIVTQLKKRHLIQWEHQMQYDRVYNVLKQQKNEQNLRRIIRA